MADSNRVQLYYLAESTWGTTPSSALTAMRFTQESLSYGIQTTTSNEIRSDRQVTDLILTSAQASGGVNFELSYGSYDDIFMASLMSSAWSAALTVSATNIAAATTGNKYTSVSTNFVTAGVTAGTWIQVAGFANAANNGYAYVISVSTTEVAVSGLTLVTESAGPTVTMKGAYIRNGTTEKSFTLERYHTDVTQYFVYKGMVPNQFSMSLSAGSIITGSFNFLGKSETLQQTTAGTGAANAATTTEIMNTTSNVGTLMEGSTLASFGTGVYINSLDMSLSNNVRALSGIGSLAAVDLGYGRCDVTGNMSVYFVNNALYDKFINNTRSGLSWRMTDAAGNAYIVTMPSIEFSSATANVGGGNQDVMLNIGYTAIRNSTYNYTIQICRFPVA